MDTESLSIGSKIKERDIHISVMSVINWKKMF